MAGAFGSDKLIISDDEAKRLAGAAQRVAAHYELPGIAQETKDWIGLITAVGAVYGPRLMASRIEKSAAKRQPEETQSADVIQFTGLPANNPLPPGA